MTEPGRASVAVVVVSYASHDLLESSLGSVDVEAVQIVVDNLSSTAERTAVTRLATAHGWHLVAMPSNDGFGAAVNAGVAVARDHGCRHVVVLNPDARLAPGSLGRLVASVRADQRSLVGPRVLRPDGSEWFSGGVVDLAGGRTRRTDGVDATLGPAWLTGACLAFDVEQWHLAGGMDDDYFMYWEDVDLAVRWVRAGGRLVHDPASVVVHDVGGTQGSGRAKSPLYYRYNCRNRLVFAAKHLDGDHRRRWARGTLRYAWEVLLRGGRRQLVTHPWRSWGAASRGSIAGLWHLARAGRAPSDQ